MSTCCVTPAPARVKHAAPLAALYQALADPTRLRILAILADARYGELCVCHIHGGLGLPQPTTSRHLASLRKAGLVSERQIEQLYFKWKDIPVEEPEEIQQEPAKEPVTETKPISHSEIAENQPSTEPEQPATPEIELQIPSKGEPQHPKAA